MKKLLTLAFVCLAYAISFGQNVPQGIAYQAVAVKDGAYSVAGQNPQAIYWSNKEIKVRFTLFDKYPNGSSQYSEVHTTSTDDYGVFNLIIGQGSGLSGDFTTIPWELGDAHLQVEIDFENTNTFTLTALEKFWSVPYAFISNETDASSIDSAIQALNDKITYLKDRDQDTVVGNELQALSLSGDSLFISDGNTVVVNHPANLDNDSTNEIQSLTIKGDSLSISDGNAVKIDHPANLDNDSTNEIQTISLNNDTISLSNGGGKIALEEVNKYILTSRDSMNFIQTGSVIGFDSDTIWKCPKNVNRIIVELWGAGGGGASNFRGPSCSCSGCGPSVSPGLSGGKGGYNKRIINVIADSTYKIFIGEGGCLSGKGDTTFFDTLAVAMGGAGGVGSNVRCDYSSYAMKVYRSASIGTDGQVNNWDYNNLYQTTVPNYIPTDLISNREGLFEFSLANGGQGGTNCPSTRADNGYLIIRY